MSTDSLPPKEPGAGLWRTEEDDKFLANQEKIPPKSEQTDAVSQPIMQGCLPPTDSYHTNLKERLQKINSELNSPEISAERLLELQDEVEGMIPQNDETSATQKSTIGKINQMLQEKGGLWSKPLKGNRESPPSPTRAKAEKTVTKPILERRPVEERANANYDAIDPMRIGPHLLLQKKRSVERNLKEALDAPRKPDSSESYLNELDRQIGFYKKKSEQLGNLLEAKKSRKLTPANLKKELFNRWTLISLLSIGIIISSIVFITRHDILKEQLSEHDYKAIINVLDDPNTLYLNAATVGLFILGVSTLRPTSSSFYQELSLSKKEKELLKDLAKVNKGKKKLPDVLKNATSSELEKIYYMSKEFEALNEGHIKGQPYIYPEGMSHSVTKKDIDYIKKTLTPENITALKYFEQECAATRRQNPRMHQDRIKSATLQHIRNQEILTLDRANVPLSAEELDNLKQDLENGFDKNCKDEKRAKIFISFLKPLILAEKIVIPRQDNINIFDFASDLSSYSIDKNKALEEYANLSKTSILSMEKVEVVFSQEMEYFLKNNFGEGIM